MFFTYILLSLPCTRRMYHFLRATHISIRTDLPSLHWKEKCPYACLSIQSSGCLPDVFACICMELKTFSVSFHFTFSEPSGVHKYFVFNVNQHLFLFLYVCFFFDLFFPGVIISIIFIIHVMYYLLWLSLLGQGVWIQKNQNLHGSPHPQ